MEEHIVKILQIERVTHDVRRYTVEKPSGYTFIPGQATDVAINKPNFRNELRPFTFTGLTDWPNLEFTIKSYSHEGVTKELGTLKEGDELILHDVWGAIQYYGEGNFIAGGAGVTPFIAILRDLKSKNQIGSNKLFFSNKNSSDIIMKDEFKEMLGSNFHNTLTREQNPAFDHQRISEDYLRRYIRNFSSFFYVCGPDSFVQDVNSLLQRLGTKSELLVFEK